MSVPQRTVNVVFADHCQETFMSVLLPVRISVGPLVSVTAVQLAGTLVGVAVPGVGVFGAGVPSA